MSEAALSPDWLTPFDGSGIEWHEHLLDSGPYTYQPSDLNKLVAAVHEYECEVLRLRKERDLVYGELDKALGSHAPQAWDRIKAALDLGEWRRKPKPDYDPHIDYPERYTDGRPV